MNRAVFTSLLLIVAFAFVSTGDRAEARRRHHKFKGIIIVNQILKLEGTIKNNGVQVPEYSGVKIGDVLETGDKSEAVIRIPGLAIFKMGPNTRMRLTNFADRNVSRFQIDSGSVLCLFRRVGQHEIKLPHSTLTIHGTTFFVDADQTRDKVCLCDGKMQVDVIAGADAGESGGKRKPQAEKSAAASPSTSPASLAKSVIAAPILAGSPSPGALVKKPEGSPADLVRVPNPSPTAQPSPSPALMSSEVRSLNEHKQFVITGDGIVFGDQGLLEHHTNKEIQDLESVYALP